MVAPQLRDRVGIFSSGHDRKEVADITIGSRQSVALGLKKFSKINLIVIDEAHLMSDDGQFDHIISYFLALNPRLRVLGITGTPYRLKGGFIYGEGKRFPKLAHRTGMKEMIEAGFLSPFKYKMKVDQKMKDDLEKIALVSGEYNQGSLGETMQDSIHMNSVRIAIEEHAQDRKHIIAFATNIKHAEALAFVLKCKCVHSQMHKDDVRKNIDDFKNGVSRILVNVGILSIGFDAPITDCAVLARPTMSPAMYTQMIGRALRISEGKKDALILDLVGNYSKHGSPMDPYVKEAKKKEPEPNVCPECFDVVPPELSICPECGYNLKEIVEAREKKEKKLEQERILMEEIDVKKSLVVKKWAKDPHITGKGNYGILFCIKVRGKSKPLFKFAGHNSKWMDGVVDNFNKIEVGEYYEIQENSYGGWITV